MKVSVIIPSYNYERYLHQRIDTVLNQSFKDIEVIVLDDASTDNSWPLIESYLNKDSRLKAGKGDQNSGNTYFQWNKGFEMAQGEYIWIAEADDYANTDFLAEMIPIMENNPTVGMAYCQSNTIDSSGKIIGDMSYWTADLNRELWDVGFKMSGKEFVSKFLSIRCVIPNASAIVFRKKALVEVGGAETGIGIAGDWKMYNKLLKQYDIAYLPKKLNFFRWHSHTMREKTTIDMVKEFYHLLDFIKEDIPISNEIYEKALDDRYHYMLRPLLYGKGWESFKKTRAEWAFFKSFDKRLNSRILTSAGFVRTLKNLIKNPKINAEFEKL